MIGSAEIRNAKILIVDDSAVNVTLLTRILETAGYTAVESTSKSTEVAARYAADHHDLILLDLMMPDMDGFEVIEALHPLETEGYLPVVVLTAQPSQRLQALTAGARDFITKPFDQAEVLVRIHNAIETRLLLQESRNFGRLLERNDQLTGLPNRRRFRELLQKALARPTLVGETITLLFISVDRFEVVSNVLGRTIGGAMLSAVADRLTECLSPMSTLARLEGADFGVVLVTPVGANEEAEVVTLRLRDALRDPILVGGHELAATLSVGVAVAHRDAPDADTLLACADRALGEARAAGGDVLRHYSPQLNAAAAAAHAHEMGLRRAPE